jgi:hypothetical protein
VPAVPVADGSYVVLAQVAVAALAASITNANITLNTSATRAYTVALGGTLPVANAAARTALPTNYPGLVRQLDTGEIWQLVSGVWGRVLGGAWQTYSPTLRSYGGDAAIGNATIDARYMQTGKTVHVDFLLTTTGANTATWGTGGGGITGLLPVTPRRTSTEQMELVLRSITSGADTARYSLNHQTTFHDIVASGGGGVTGNLGNSNQYRVKHTYEAA